MAAVSSHAASWNARETSDVRTVVVYRQSHGVWAPEVTWCSDDDMLAAVPRLIGIIESKGMLVFQDPRDGTIHTRNDVVVALGSVSPCNLLMTTPATTGILTVESCIMQGIDRVWTAWLIPYVNDLNAKSMVGKAQRILIANSIAIPAHASPMLTQAMDYTDRIMDVLYAVVSQETTPSITMDPLACVTASVFDVVARQMVQWLQQRRYDTLVDNTPTFFNSTEKDILTQTINNWAAYIKRGIFFTRDPCSVFNEWRLQSMRFFRTAFPTWMERARVRCANGTIHCLERRELTVENYEQIHWRDSNGRSIPYQGTYAPRVLAYLIITPESVDGDTIAQIRTPIGNLLVARHFCKTNQVMKIKSRVRAT